MLKKALTSDPIVQQPDFTREFILYTDASNVALGAILAQVDSEGRERVCFYASRLLKGPELHYSISEKECLAVVWAIKYFRIYLYHSKFKVITDHIALKWLKDFKEPTGRLARCMGYSSTKL